MKCRECRKPFSFRAGTVMTDSPVNPGAWVRAYEIASGKFGVRGIKSEIMRATGMTYKSAWWAHLRLSWAVDEHGDTPSAIFMRTKWDSMKSIGG